MLSAEQRERMERSKQQALLRRKMRQPHSNTNDTNDTNDTSNDAVVANGDNSSGSNSSTGAHAHHKHDKVDKNTTISDVKPSNDSSDCSDAIMSAAPEHPAKRMKTAEGAEVCAACRASAQLDPAMQKHFNELVCFNCRDGREEYNLLCKADMVAEYLLPEGTIRVLPFMEKENPKKEGWNKMKLFLRKHAIERAMQRWGTMEELAAEKQRRKTAKYARAVKKVKEVLHTTRKQP